MAEYIEREAVAQEILGLTIMDSAVAAYADAVLDRIQRIPAAHVAPVVYGWWVHDPASSYRVNIWFCSACNGEATRKYNRCPSCGAKMEEAR